MPRARFGRFRRRRHYLLKAALRPFQKGSASCLSSCASSRPIASSVQTASGCSDASETCKTAADGGVEVERATNDVIAGARQDREFPARAASARADGLAMRGIEPFLAAPFQRGVDRDDDAVFEDVDLVGENLDVEDAA